ncbi:MAG: C1 family peptidase [Ferruginibacter sp.]
MKKILFLVCLSVSLLNGFSQDATTTLAGAKTPTKNEGTKNEIVTPQKATVVSDNDFVIEKVNPVTTVKNQAQSNTCWAFSTTSLLESQAIKNNIGVMDISEMFIVRNMYIEKAKNYVLRQGHAQFGEGGLGHDVIRAINLYGAVPENVYTGFRKPEQKLPDHTMLAEGLKKDLDSVILWEMSGKKTDWLPGFISNLDNRLGFPQSNFVYSGVNYTPKSFSKDVLKFNAADYVNITSFTHHPFYEPFILEVPDNFSNGSYYNLPLNEMIDVVKNAVRNGYTVLWDADVSNRGFRQNKGLALLVSDSMQLKADFTAGTKESTWNQDIRQQLFENLTTQDDHLMHIVGIEKSKDGKTFFVVKNSWGDVGPYKGFIQVSEAYFAINTISLVVPKAAIAKPVLDRIGVQ